MCSEGDPLDLSLHGVVVSCGVSPIPEYMCMLLVDMTPKALGSQRPRALFGYRACGSGHGLKESWRLSAAQRAGASQLVC